MKRRALLAGLAAAGATFPALARPDAPIRREVTFATYGVASSSADIENLTRLRPGQVVRLSRHANRMADTCTIAIHDLDGTRVGYLPPRSCGALAALLDSGWKGVAEVLSPPAGRRVDLSATLIQA